MTDNASRESQAVAGSEERIPWKPRVHIRFWTEADGLYTRELLGYVDNVPPLDDPEYRRAIAEHRRARAAKYRLD